MGDVVQFPVRSPARLPSLAAGQFTPEMRRRLAVLATAVPAYQPLVFGVDENGLECCRFADCLMVGWTRERRLMLIDATSGYVDHGPFDSLDEVCSVIASLTPWTEPPLAERRRAGAATRHPGRR